MGKERHLSPEEEFKLRLDPDSCPYCGGTLWVENEKTKEYCTCPAARANFEESMDDWVSEGYNQYDPDDYYFEKNGGEDYMDIDEDMGSPPHVEKWRKK